MDVRAGRARRLPRAAPRGAPLSGALILTGAPGAGKSSVLDALCTLFEIDEVPFGAIESEQFSRGHPWLALAEWLPQLTAVVALQRDAGRDTFLVAATTAVAREIRDALVERGIVSSG